MAAIISSNFTFPTEVANGIWKKAQDVSALARLSGQSPQKFGTSSVMVLTSAPKAELVGEGAQKSETPSAYEPKQVVPRKLQVTMRCSDEVRWADEDYQLGILNDMIENAGVSLGRALDLVGIHKINPLTGAVAASVTEGLADTQNSATYAAATGADAAIEAAAGLIIADGYTPTGLALDPVFSFALATQRDNDKRRMYPELGFGRGADQFEGMALAVSDTVSAKSEAATPTGVLGVVGQFDAFKWGIQREIRAHLIEAGDPDGQGDLNRLNQVAIRAEIVYGIGIMALDAFATIVS